MGSCEEPPHRPWITTPCIESASLSRAAGCQVFLKLENLQPSGSFKSRGIGNLMIQALANHGPHKPIHFYCSSGGNAGLACAKAAISIKRPATVVVSLATSASMIDKLKALGADVHQIGAGWFEADKWMREELIANDENAVYVPPFDHEDIWHGNSTLVPEISSQIGHFDGIVCSVGGGGLINGIVEGVNFLNHRLPSSFDDIKVLAMETYGANSLGESVRRGEHITLPAITSIATSLGASRVSARTWEYMQQENVVNAEIEDRDAANACVRFADDERILVEAACGASVAPFYSGLARKMLAWKNTKFDILDDEEWKEKKIVLVLCGGSNVSLETLKMYKEKYGGSKS